jgi:hypothetical protein
MKISILLRLFKILKEDLNLHLLLINNISIKLVISTITIILKYHIIYISLLLINRMHQIIHTKDERYISFFNNEFLLVNII